MQVYRPFEFQPFFERTIEVILFVRRMVCKGVVFNIFELLNVNPTLKVLDELA